ncbi:MAG TPA: extracellular solute-binding protein [Firmicutes bacterium]|nr:extracellular solute-binding protein [Bacillota bacterium]
MARRIDPGSGPPGPARIWIGSGMKIIKIIKWATVVILALGACAAVGIPLARPEVLPPHRYHPRAVYYRLRGIRVHPLVPMDPNKRYELEVWETDWPVQATGKVPYREFLRKLIAEFRERRPNVSIECTFLPFHSDPGERLKSALDAASPPDIYIGPFNPRIMTSGLGVPLTVFFADEQRAAFEPAAITLTTRRGDIWAWPRWLELWGWAGNAKLLRKAGIEPGYIISNGWTWSEFIEIGRKLTQGNAFTKPEWRIYGLTLDTTRTDAFEHLLLNDGAAPLNWTRAQIAETAAFLEVLGNEGILPPEPDTASGELLELFWEGRTAVIGPVGPALLRHLWERGERVRLGQINPGPANLATSTLAPAQVEPVLLPIPSRTRELRATPAAAVAFHIFRRPRPGDSASADETARIAVELARHLASGRGAWLAARLKAIPALRADQAWWADDFQVGLLADLFIRESLRYARSITPELPGDIEKLNAVRQKVLAPALAQFWRGRVTASRLAEEIDAGTRSVLGSPTAGDQ